MLQLSPPCKIGGAVSSKNRRNEPSVQEKTLARSKPQRSFGALKESSVSWVAKFKGDKNQNASCQMGAREVTR